MSAWKRILIGGDVHGDKQHKKTVAAFLKFNGLWKPDIRILNGDVWDFRPLRRKASQEEKRESMIADYEAGQLFIQKFVPTHFVRGNHDERLWDLASVTDGILSDYALGSVNSIERSLREIRCRMLPYHKREGVLRIGSLKVVHGFGGAGVNAARRHASAYGSVIVNHFHSIQQASIEGLENRIGRVIGCLCELDMDYNRTHLGSLMHRHGFAYGVVHERSGLYHIYQAEEIDGKWLLPTGLEEL